MAIHSDLLHRSNEIAAHIHRYEEKVEPLNLETFGCSIPLQGAAEHIKSVQEAEDEAEDKAEMAKKKYLKMPFMFARTKEVFGYEIEKFIVVIAYPFDYSHANTAWMDDPNMPDDRTIHPEVDMQAEDGYHEFDTEKEMIDFVADWWINWKNQ